MIAHEVVDPASLWKKSCLDAKYLQFHTREIYKLHSTPIDGAAICKRHREVVFLLRNDGCQVYYTSVFTFLEAGPTVFGICEIAKALAQGPH